MNDLLKGLGILLVVVGELWAWVAIATVFGMSWLVFSVIALPLAPFIALVAGAWGALATSAVGFGLLLVGSRQD